LHLIKENPAALSAGAHARGIDLDVYVTYLTMLTADPDAAPPQDTAQAQEMQDNIMAGMEAAAVVLDTDVYTLARNMGRIKNDSQALAAMVEASTLPEPMVIGIINQQLAQNEINLDRGVDFNVGEYLTLNFGVFLLMFAIGSISFLFSCVFNLTKNSLALGAGIPIGFLIMEIMSQAGSDLEVLRFFSLNTLFDPSAVTGGGTFVLQYIALAVIGIVLYVTSITVFKKKDLPL